MRSTLRFSSLVVLAVASACATTPAAPPSVSTTAEPSLDGLFPVDNSVLQYAEVKPDLDLSVYDGFILGPVEVSYQKEPSSVRLPGSGDSNFGLDARQMTTLKEVFTEQLDRALTEDDGYNLVTEPGPGVLRLDAYLLDLIVRVDVNATAGRNREFVDSYGEVTMILELRDSQSGEILARVGERRDPTRGNNELVEVNRSFVRADVTSMFRHWASVVRERLDDVRAAELGTAGGS